jgi:hypothetical protein
MLLTCVWCGGEALNHLSAVSAAPIHFKLGLCEDYPKESRTIEQARRDLLAYEHRL